MTGTISKYQQAGDTYGFEYQVAPLAHLFESGSACCKAGPDCQVALEARLGEDQQRQLNAQSISQSRQLAASTSAFPDNSLTLHHAAVDCMADAAIPHPSIGLPATQQSLQQQQHIPHVPEALSQGGVEANAYATADQAPIGPQISQQPGLRSSESEVDCGQQQQQQQQQAPPGQSNQTGADVGVGEPGAQTQQEVALPAENVMLGQESSSMMSLSPSLKLDIPGLDDMLDTHMLSESEDQAVSPPLSSAQQQHQHSLNHQHTQQQGIEQQQLQEHQGGLPSMQDVAVPPAGGQAPGVHPTAISAPCAPGLTSQPVPSPGLLHPDQQSAADGISQDPSAHQPGQASPRQHAELSQPDTATAQLAGASQPSAAAAGDDDDDNGSQRNVSAARQGLQPKAALLRSLMLLSMAPSHKRRLCQAWQCQLSASLSPVTIIAQATCLGHLHRPKRLIQGGQLVRMMWPRCPHLVICLQRCNRLTC